MANLFLEGQEADGLLDAAEGDVEGVEVFERTSVPGEGRGGEAELGAQGAEGEAVHQGLVDFRQGGVVADGTALVHGFGNRVPGSGFWIKESGERLSGQGPKGQ